MRKVLSLALLALSACVFGRPNITLAAPGEPIDMAARLSITAPLLVTWSATCGTVDGIGMWTAPACAGNAFPMTCAVAAAQGGVTLASATVVVNDKVTGIRMPPPPECVATTPPYEYFNGSPILLRCTVEVGKTIQFTAVVQTLCNP